MKKWLLQDGSIQPHIGGRFEWTIADTEDTRAASGNGRIDIFIPNYRMRLVIDPQDGQAPLPTGPLTIDFRLARHGDYTRLTVTPAGFPADEAWEEDFNWATMMWPNALQRLADLLSA